MKTKTKETTIRTYSELDWDYFCTLKVNNTLTVDNIHKEMDNYVKRLKYNTTIFYVVDKYNMYDGYHIHALIKTRDKSEYVSKMWECKNWTQKNGTYIVDYDKTLVMFDFAGKVVNEGVVYMCNKLDDRTMNYNYVMNKRPSKRRKYNIKDSVNYFD